MTITNKTIGEAINLADVLNTKLEKPILQSEMELDTQATATGQSVRWDEFSLKHNDDGSFKGIDQSDMDLTSKATASGKSVRYNEWTKRHSDDGYIKQLMYKKSALVNPASTRLTSGNSVSYFSANGYYALLPLGIDIVCGGTFGSGESITVDFTIFYVDSGAPYGSLSKTIDATGTISLSNEDMMAFVTDGELINAIYVESSSNIDSSAVTVTVNHYGIHM